MEWHDLLLTVIQRYYDPRGDVHVHPSSAGEVPPGGGHTRRNRSCGDTVTVHTRHGAECIPVEIRVQGCAVCKAAAAMAEQAMQYLTRDQGLALCAAIIDRIEGESHLAGETTIDRIEGGSRPDGEATETGTFGAGGSPADEAREDSALQGSGFQSLEDRLSCLPRSLREDILAMTVLRDVPGRRRCATLSWEALREALEGVGEE